MKKICELIDQVEPILQGINSGTSDDLLKQQLITVRNSINNLVYYFVSE